MSHNRTITHDYHKQETDEETESVSARSEERESIPDIDDLDEMKRRARLSENLIEAQGQRVEEASTVRARSGERESGAYSDIDDLDGQSSDAQLEAKVQELEQELATVENDHNELKMQLAIVMAEEGQKQLEKLREFEHEIREQSTPIPFPITALPISGSSTYYLRLFHTYSGQNWPSFYSLAANGWSFSLKEPRPSAGLVKVTPISDNRRRSLCKFEFLHSHYCDNFELLKYAYQTEAFIMKGTGLNGKFFPDESYLEQENREAKHFKARQFVLEPSEKYLAKQMEALKTGWYAIKFRDRDISGYIAENRGGHLIMMKQRNNRRYKVEMNEDASVSIFSSNRDKYLHLDAGAFLFNAASSSTPDARFELYDVKRHEGHEYELDEERASRIGRSSIYIPTYISARMKSLANGEFLRVEESKNRKGQAMFSTVYLYHNWEATEFHFEVQS